MGLKEKIARAEFAPYVYSYPPTRTYRPVTNFSLSDPVFTSRVNVYIHIPFCEQKCTFCGYLTMIARSDDVVDRYVDCIVREIARYREILETKEITSINFGGGTPSLLTGMQFAKIMRALIAANPALAHTAQEISIEATPESVLSSKIAKFREYGLNRVSVGIQTFNDAEIALAKRRNIADISVQTFETLRGLGIPNICCDLMYGLAGQTTESWEESVTELLRLTPDTVELYSTVTIPGTPLARAIGAGMLPQDRLHCYERARGMFLEAGYVQDCHLRFVISGRGFYRQQENVFAGESLIGFGAGARSYAVNMHYRNTFDGMNHRQVVGNYMRKMQSGHMAVESAVMLTIEEKLRRYVIYRIEHLDKKDFEEKFGMRFEGKFYKEYCELLSLGLLKDRNNTIRLTAKGLAFRDVIAREFFSANALSHEAAYYAPQ